MTPDVPDQTDRDSTLAAIVESSDDAIFSKTLEGIVTSWNRGAELLYGYAPHEILGRPAAVLLPTDRPGEIDQILRRIRRGDRVDHFETVRLRKDGTCVAVSVTISPVHDTTGSITGASSTARDISGRKGLEDANEASRLKSAFLAQMSHEIRTPMNAVIGMTGLLLDTGLNDQQREYAETVRGSGEVLLEIINDILDFSKIEAGKLELEMLEFAPRVVVDEVGDLLAERAHAKGLELITLLQPDVPQAIRTDPGRLRQILTNLVSNAIKFTQSGEVVVRVSMAEETGDDVVLRFEVADTGIGITPDEQTRLFQPFSQADVSTTRKHGGTGLGLAIAKQLVELMGGEISVKSAVPLGSTFSFTIRAPRVAPREPVIHAAPDELRGRRVLIVDDNAANRTILEHQVVRWEMRTESVEGGAQAVAELRRAVNAKDPYALVLLDMNLPGFDGFGVARAVKRDPLIAGTPLLLLTSSGVRGSAEVSRALGIAAYLTKPVKQSQLHECITLVLSAGDLPDRFVTRHSVSAARARSKPRLLVAEDNVANQKVAVGMLARLGYRADVVANGLEVLEATARTRYGAILMDCHMPEMDGYETTRQIRARHGASDHLPIIAMTAGAYKTDADRCLAAGMDDYLPKPVDIGRLEASLAKWVPAGGETPHEAEAAPPTLDSAQLRQLRALGAAAEGGLESLVEVFLDSSVAGIERLKATALNGSTEGVAHEAHYLRGAASTYAAGALAGVCRRIEELARAGAMPSPELLARVDVEFERFRETLARELSGARPLAREAAGL